MTSRAQRKRHRRAVIGAIALLEWRDRMRRENADRERAERETTMRYERMVAEMRAEAAEFWAPRPATPRRLVVVRSGPPTSRASHSS
jgi:hypothetical protein